FDQVVEIFLRAAQRRAVGVLALAPDVEIGIEALLQREDLDLKIFFHKQTKCAFGRLRSGGIGIEVDHNVLAEAAQQLGLDLGEGRAGAGDHVVKTGGVDGNAS